MPVPRLLTTGACILGCAVVPGAAGATGPGASTAESTVEPTPSHLIRTPRGTRLAVPLSISYRTRRANAPLERSVLTTRVTTAVRLPGGRILRASERRRFPGKASQTVEHHVFFSPAQTRLLRSALARGRLRLMVLSLVVADVDGDGHSDARSTRRTRSLLRAPSHRRPGPRGPRQRGDDPCAASNLPATRCTNVTGATWEARYTWDSTSTDIRCPAAFPVATDSVSTDTTATRFTQSVTFARGGRVARILTIDENSSDHPTQYTPTVACTAPR